MLQQVGLAQAERRPGLLRGGDVGQRQGRQALPANGAGVRVPDDVLLKVLRDREVSLRSLSVGGGQFEGPLEVSPRGGQIERDGPVGPGVFPPAGRHGFFETERTTGQLSRTGHRQEEALVAADHGDGQDVLPLGELEVKGVVAPGDRR